MSDSLKGCTVTFEAELGPAASEQLVAAIRQLRGVIHVEPSVSTIDDHIAREQARFDLREKLWTVLWEKP